MPLLEAAAPPPARPCRIPVAGSSGSGKTTLAGRLASALGTEHTELDGLHHGPNWTPRPSFADDVERFSAGPEWVTEWQYTAVRDLLADRADLIGVAGSAAVDGERPPHRTYSTHPLGFRLCAGPIATADDWSPSGSGSDIPYNRPRNRSEHSPHLL